MKKILTITLIKKILTITLIKKINLKINKYNIVI